MDKKKVKEKLDKIQRTLDSLRGYNDRINKLVLILDDCIKDALKELSKSDWISVEDEPAPRLEWDGSWNDIVVCYKDKWVLPLSYVVRNDVEFTHWRRIEKLEE